MKLFELSKSLKTFAAVLTGLVVISLQVTTALAAPTASPSPVATTVPVATTAATTPAATTPTPAVTAAAGTNTAVTPTPGALTGVPTISPQQKADEYYQSVNPITPTQGGQNQAGQGGSTNVTPYTQTTGFMPSKDLMELKPASKCFVVFGDSRSCSVLSTLISDKTWKNIYTCINFPYSDGVVQKGDTIIVICAEAGGYFDNGAYTRAYSRFNKINESTQGLVGSTVHYYCNLFGVNDVMIARRNSCPDYTKMNEAIRRGQNNADVFYQFTAGPISETGSAVLTNAEIEKYNSNFKKSNHLEIIDLYTYLKDGGFVVKMGPEDDTGLHYNSDTNYKIIGLILSLAGTPAPEAAPTPLPTLAPVSPTPVPTVVPVTPTPVPTVAPATSTPVIVVVPETTATATPIGQQ